MEASHQVGALVPCCDLMLNLDEEAEPNASTPSYSHGLCHRDNTSDPQFSPHCFPLISSGRGGIGSDDIIRRNWEIQR